jgi:hypothetical protein
MLLFRVVVVVGRLAPDMAEEEEVFDAVRAFDVGCSEVYCLCHVRSSCRPRPFQWLCGYLLTSVDMHTAEHNRQGPRVEWINGPSKMMETKVP